MTTRKPVLVPAWLASVYLVATALFATVDALYSHGLLRVMCWVTATVSYGTALATLRFIVVMRRLSNQPPPAPWAAKMADAAERMRRGIE